MRITAKTDTATTALHQVVQQHARAHGLEGFVQSMPPDQIKIIICGKLEDLDAFLDEIHKEAAALKLQDLEIEPFLKDRDYRGVFRIIE